MEQSGVIILIAAIIAAISSVLSPLITEWYRQRKARIKGVFTGEEVTYRSIIKLIHVKTGCLLHSHPFEYSHPKSSKQQQVTAFGGFDNNDYWIVKAAHGFSELHCSGKPIKQGDIIRLEHRTTRKNLHSHIIAPSPVSGQQEVTAFGTDGIGNTDDNWRIDVEDSKLWLEGSKVRFIHINTGVALHSHGGYSHPEYTLHQQEVTGYSKRNDDDWWQAAIYEHSSS